MNEDRDMDRSAWPEENWERRRPWVELEVDELAAICGHTLGREDVVGAELLSGGKCNTNIRVELSDASSVVVRVYERDADACRRDEVITELVRPAVPAPQMLAAVSEPANVLPEPLSRKLDGRPIGVFEWAEGVEPYRVFERGEADACGQVAFELGATLAAIARARRFEDHGLLDADLGYRRRFEGIRASFVDFIDWSLEEGRAGERLGAELAGRLSRYAHERASMLDALEGDHGLVHGDYKLSNLLVRSDGEQWRVSAVLDWEFALAGSPLFDIAILLRHRACWPEGRVEAFAEGFVTHGGTLPPRWREIARLVDLMNLCGFLNASGQRKQTFAAVRELIEATVDAP
jgi:Ser/Thr protein kinase RdoA (MazF antagonist)